MADTNATYTRSVVCDLPDYASQTITFTLLSFFAAAGTESFPKKVYTLTLDASGTGTQVLPVPDNTGTASWKWEVKLPDEEPYIATLAYNASSIQLTTWLASAVSTETPNSLADSFVNVDGDTMTGLLQFSGTDHPGIRLISLTTAERDALTPAEGDIIYNETTTTVQVYQGAAWVSVGSLASYLPLAGGTMAGNINMDGNDITNMGDITFQTGATGGTLRTGTSNADKFVLAAYDVNDGTYRTVIELDAGNDVVLQIIGDYLAIEDAADTTKHVEWDISGATGSTTTTFIFVQTANRNITFPDETGTVLTNQGGTLAGDFNMADNTINRPVIEDYGETVNAIGSIGGGTQDIDLTLGNVVSGTVDTSETTFTFSNPPASGTAGSFTLFLTNGGSQTVNWPASVDWAGGTAPTLTAAGVDILTFTTIDGGTIWYGFAAGLAMA